MNAITQPRPDESFADRTLRHLRMCREFAELGLEMARSAAQAAREEWTPPADAPPNPAPQTRTRTKPPSPHPDARRETASPSLAFARITNAVQRVMNLEATLSDRHKAELQAAADAAHARACLARNTQAQPAAPVAPAPHRPTRKQDDIPSILANISREIGIDLEDPTLASRLPSFHHPP